jgi:hypothetical protein
MVKKCGVEALLFGATCCPGATAHESGSQDLEILLDFGRFGTAMQEQRANKSWHLHTLRYQ